MAKRPYFHRNDKRVGIERREYSYDAHIPERRSDRERRIGVERRRYPRPA